MRGARALASSALLALSPAPGAAAPHSYRLEELGAGEVLVNSCRRTSPGKRHLDCRPLARVSRRSLSSFTDSLSVESRKEGRRNRVVMAGLVLLVPAAGWALGSFVARCTTISQTASRVVFASVLVLTVAVLGYSIESLAPLFGHSESNRTLRRQIATRIVDGEAAGPFEEFLGRHGRPPGDLEAPEGPAGTPRP